MKYAVVTLPRFAEGARRIAEFLHAEMHLYHADVFREVYETADCIVALMSSGIAVRGCAPLLTDKWHDTALVVVTPDLSYAVPVLGGHHGANECVKRLVGLGITPVISTATEVFGKVSVEETAKQEGCVVVNRSSTRKVNGAVLDTNVPVLRVDPPKILVANPGVSVLVNESRYVVGIGCRMGTAKEEILSALSEAYVLAGISGSTLFSTTQKKFHEAGLHEAAAEMGANLIFLDDATINAQVPQSTSRASMLGLLGVAEPCALALSEKGQLVLKKTVFGRVTIAIGE